MALSANSGAINALKGTNQQINGHFMHYAEGPYDWAYLSADGSLLAKLEGMDPQSGFLEWKVLDMTGFSEVDDLFSVQTIRFGTTQSSDPVVQALAGTVQAVQGHFVHYAAGPYDWAYVTPDGMLVAKLGGMEAATGMLQWELLDTNDFARVVVASDGKSVNFGANMLPPGSVNYPETGATLARFDSDQSDDYIELIGTSGAAGPVAPLTRIQGVAGGEAFYITYVEGRPADIAIGSWVLTMSYDVEDAMNYSPQVNTALATAYPRSRVAECSKPQSYYQADFERAGSAIKTFVTAFMMMKYNLLVDGEIEQDILDALMSFTYHELASSDYFNAMIERYIEAQRNVETYGETCMQGSSSSVSGLGIDVCLLPKALRGVEWYDKTCTPESSGSSSSVNSTGCGANEVLIEGSCFNYLSENIPTRAALDAVMANPVITCPRTDPGSYIQGCHYDYTSKQLIYQNSYVNGVREGTGYGFDAAGEINYYEQYHNGKEHGILIWLGQPADAEMNYRVYENGTALVAGVIRLDGSWWYEDEAWWQNNGAGTGYVLYFAAGNELYSISEYVQKRLVKIMYFENDVMSKCQAYDENYNYTGSCMP